MHAHLNLAAQAYAATGAFHAIASGRLSYVLGLQGPCVGYDTACSAHLVATHGGLRAWQLDESSISLVMGVNVMLTPDVTWQLATAGMTSVRGRSHTFDARADGYARGEACAVFVLQADDICQLRVNLSGSAVRQDGKTASLTAPSGQSQRGLVLSSLADANATRDALRHIEAHGTGTALGDPIEMGSLHAAAVKGRRHPEALTIGSVKANAGHAEPSAGGTGLLKLALSMYQANAAPNAQLRVLNRHLLATVKGSALTTALFHFGASHKGLTASGVSSFGYSGTIAHTVLSGAWLGKDSAVAAKRTLRLYRRRNFQYRPNQLTELLSDVARYSTLFRPMTDAAVPPAVQCLVLQAMASDDRSPSEDNKALITHSIGNNASLDADLCIVGVGLVGLIIARDIASCGFSSVALERESTIGGVWAKNDYPGLGLQHSGASYRCLSLAPTWQREGQGRDDLLYAPRAKEILKYLNQMADHELIAIRPRTDYRSHQRSGSGHVVSTTQGPVSARGVVFATGAFETTTGSPYWPINPSQVTNGACVMHSSGLTTGRAEFEAAKTRYIVGSSKAAIDLLEWMDPDDDRLVWAHRGHMIFHHRGRMESAWMAAKPSSPEEVSHLLTGNLYLKNQQFDAAFGGMLKRGHAIHVGLPLAAQPWLRGGFETDESLAHARKFLPHQVIITSLRCHEGVLQMSCADGVVINVGPHDAVVLCTGQRSESGGEASYSRSARLNKDGLFHVYAQKARSRCLLPSDVHMLCCSRCWLKVAVAWACMCSQVCPGTNFATVRPIHSVLRLIVPERRAICVY